MDANQPIGAFAPRSSTPTSDEAPAVASGEGFNENKNTTQSHFRIDNAAQQAPRPMQRGGDARDFLDRLPAQQADPDELALIVVMLYGAALHWFCAVIAKALRTGGAA